MEKLTVNINGVNYINKNGLTNSDNGFYGDAADNLAKFEALYFDTLAKQDDLSVKLAELREDGKTNTVKFKELMGQKLINTSILSAFKGYMM